MTASTKKEKGVLKLIHPGGYVEVHHKPVVTEEIMRRNPKHCITGPDVFNFPWLVVKPDSILTPGNVFFIIPNRTIYHLIKSCVPIAEHHRVSPIRTGRVDNMPAGSFFNPTAMSETRIGGVWSRVEEVAGSRGMPEETQQISEVARPCSDLQFCTNNTTGENGTQPSSWTSSDSDVSTLFSIASCWDLSIHHENQLFQISRMPNSFSWTCYISFTKNRITSSPELNLLH